VRTLSKILTVGAISVLLGMAAYLWFDVVQTLRHPRPVAVAPMKPPAGGIVWAGRVFRTPAGLRRWLHSRGASYSRWRRRFPAQARILEHRRLPPPTTTASVTQAAATTAADTRHDAATTPRRDRVRSASATRNREANRGVLLAVLLAAIGAVILLAAFAQQYRRMTRY
jgi:hypothetical protein